MNPTEPCDIIPSQVPAGGPFAGTGEGIVEEILRISHDMDRLLEGMKAVPGMYDETAATHHAICQALPGQIRSDRVRVAVVGAIKSGKSTCINALVGEEILKRGAGVVTAMVTRIRQGETKRAVVHLKSWDEINKALRRTLMLFPEDRIPAGEVSLASFDLRRKSDRLFLRAVHGRLVDGGAAIPKGMQPEYMRIRQALEGFDRVRHLVQADAVSLAFEGQRFHGHQMFTGDGAAAFFAEDVLLELPGTVLAPGVELADCQGSDSTDPCHLAQIQDYLVTANMIIYVISSRMGVREADLSFLHMIRDMGLMDSLLFLLNADLAEHDDVADLKAVAHQVKTDLYPVDAGAELHVASCLHALFSALDTTLSPVDRKRMELWHQGREVMAHALAGEDAFRRAVQKRVREDRFSLVVENHIQRMAVTRGFVGHRLTLFADLLSRDRKRCGHAMEELERMKAQGERLRAMVRRNTQSAVEVLETDISGRIHRFFDPRRGALFKGVKTFIHTAAMDPHDGEARLETAGFNRLLYTLFQEFRLAVDGYMTRWFNPRVTAFIQEQEAHIASHFRDLFDTCHVDTRELLAHLGREGDAHDREVPAMDVTRVVDLKAVKGILGVTAPRARFATAYSARIRLDAMASLGMQSLVAIIARLLKRPFASPFQSACDHARRRIRKEALHAMAAHFQGYARHLEADYFIQLIQAVSRDFQEKILVAFEGSDLEMARIQEMVAADHSEKKAQLDRVHDLEARHAALTRRMDALDISYPH